MGRTTPWKMYRSFCEEDLMEEIWKPVEGFQGSYEVSNMGTVRSYKQNRTDGKTTKGYENRKGYRVVLLYDGEGGKKWFPVHRLVAKAFLPNPHDLPQVNHKDEDKSNNRADNLEWCTNQYNARYGTKKERAGVSNRCCKTTPTPVYSVDRDGNVRRYGSIGEAERATGLCHSNIVSVLKGRRKHSGNMKWFYGS